ncbi:MAG: D-Ala-D-Ala carboxypeptidase family metallohydrolase [Gemmatimonadaceae bacterium]
MRDTRPLRDRPLGRAMTLCVTAIGAGLLITVSARVAHAAERDSVRTAATVRAEDDSLRGRSGKLRAVLVPKSDRRAGILERLFGDSLLRTPGVHTIPDSGGGLSLALITMRDFAEKLGGKIGAYRMGFWPAERRKLLATAYANPEGFIEVTPENADTHVSEHFRLRDFLTHDQQGVWPKYLVLRAPLVDKLELVISQLEARGTPVRHMSVMSGFRTPQYNARSGESGGRSKVSRHMYGDAADVFVDNDGDGRMDDLNRDGRIDYRDAQVILDAVEQVERMHGDLVGGVGVYRATRSHGPFAHVDVRGSRARWGRQ